VTAALNLPDRTEWTVEDLAELPVDLPYELINGRLIVPSPTALHDEITLTEMLPSADRRDYEFGVHTSEVFSSDRPWAVTLDLPTLTKRRAAILGETGAGGA
jgi:hypothetical protein